MCTIVKASVDILLTETDRTPEAIAAQFDELSDMAVRHAYTEGGLQAMEFVGKAAHVAGINLG